MAIMYLLAFFFLSVAIYGGLVKLTARLYRRTRISWKSAFGYGALVNAIATPAAIGLRIVFPIAAVGYAGLAVSIAVGAWFLASRAIDASGQPVGFKPALLLSAIAVVMSRSLTFALLMLYITIFAHL